GGHGRLAQRRSPRGPGGHDGGRPDERARRPGAGRGGGRRRRGGAARIVGDGAAGRWHAGRGPHRRPGRV
ncbi:MAG: Sulfur carrier protein ThiS, partial [uncultured Actinomycetospora sp.]